MNEGDTEKDGKRQREKVSKNVCGREVIDILRDIDESVQYAQNKMEYHCELKNLGARLMELFKKGNAHIRKNHNNKAKQRRKENYIIQTVRKCRKCIQKIRQTGEDTNSEHNKKRNTAFALEHNHRERNINRRGEQQTYENGKK